MRKRALLPTFLMIAVIAVTPLVPAHATPGAPDPRKLAANPLAPQQPLADPQDPDQSAAGPLAPFERLIGGQWHLDGSYHEFEWGLGRQSVRSRSYFIVEGEPKLVSEGIWFWHPGEKQIKGAFTAIDMPVVFFDYTVRFEGNKMVSDLVAFDAEGNKSAYVETWEFTDDTHYEWKLFSETPDGPREVMGGIYSKRQ